MPFNVGDQVEYINDPRYRGVIVEGGNVSYRSLDGSVAYSHTHGGHWRVTKPFERKKSGFGKFFKRMQESHPCV